VIGNDLVSWSFEMWWGVQEALFCDEAIIEQ
jgi:hypothetical protein